MRPGPIGLTLLFFKTIEGGSKEIAKGIATAPFGDIGTAIDVSSTLEGSGSSGRGLGEQFAELLVPCGDESSSDG